MFGWFSWSSISASFFRISSDMLFCRLFSRILIATVLFERLSQALITIENAPIPSTLSGRQNFVMNQQSDSYESAKRDSTLSSLAFISQEKKINQFVQTYSLFKMKNNNSQFNDFNEKYSFLFHREQSIQTLPSSSFEDEQLDQVFNQLKTLDLQIKMLQQEEHQLQQEQKTIKTHLEKQEKYIDELQNKKYNLQQNEEQQFKKIAQHLYSNYVQFQQNLEKPNPKPKNESQLQREIKTNTQLIQQSRRNLFERNYSKPRLSKSSNKY